MTGVKGKRKGGRFERKIAKELSMWMFNDSSVLYRHASSGARKKVYSGDIIPEAELYEYGWKTWPFIIELKDGYKEHTPTFLKQTQLTKWLSKLIDECTEKQYCPLFIWQIYNQSPIFMTTESLNIHWTLVFNVPWRDKNIYFYCYSYKELLKYDFFTLIPEQIKNNILL